MPQDIIFWALGLFVALVAAEQVKNFFYFMNDLKDLSEHSYKFVTREGLSDINERLAVLESKKK